MREICKHYFKKKKLKKKNNWMQVYVLYSLSYIKYTKI